MELIEKLSARALKNKNQKTTITIKQLLNLHSTIKELKEAVEKNHIPMSEIIRIFFGEETENDVVFKEDEDYWLDLQFRCQYCGIPSTTVKGINEHLQECEQRKLEKSIS